MAKTKTAKATRFPKIAAALKQPLPAPSTPEAKPAKAKRVKAEAKKMSALDAAAKVLGEAREAMTTGELIDAMGKKGYWSSPKGLTPAATLYSALLRELNVKGKEARFAKTERGKFALKP